MEFSAFELQMPQARRILETLHVRGMPAGLQPEERLHMLSTLVRQGQSMCDIIQRSP